jgi:competence protein ComEC
VLSIVIFSPYIKNWFYFKNKLLAGFWELNAITLSAQILTLPIVLYHFHQFPLLVFITNIFAVPWSGFILYAELLLLTFCSWKSAASLIGTVTEWMIKIMNKFILNIDALPFSVWESLQINIPQAIILFFAIVGCSFWIIDKKTKGLMLGLVCVLCFFSIRTVDFINRNKQQKIIVYNVPSHTAIDIVQGRNYSFIGDSVMNQEGFLRNFHIKPSRVLHRITESNSLTNIQYQNNFIITKNKIIAIVDAPISYVGNKINVDAIIVTKNPQLYISQLQEVFNCKQIIFDGSNSSWKLNYWKKDCDSLHLPYHICALQGAFEMNL